MGVGYPLRPLTAMLGLPRWGGSFDKLRMSGEGGWGVSGDDGGVEAVGVDDESCHGAPSVWGSARKMGKGLALSIM